MKNLFPIGLALSLLVLLWPASLEAQEKKQQCQLQGSPNAHLAQQMLTQAQDTTKPESQRQAAYEQAWNAVQSNVESGTDNPTPYVLGAQALVGMNRYDQASQLLDTFLEKAGEGCESLAQQIRFQAWANVYNAAIQAYNGGETEEALKQFDRANSIMEDPRSLMNAAALYEQQGETEKAMGLYERTIEAGGDSQQAKQALRRVAQHKLQQDSTERAMGLYRSYLSNNPDDVAVRVDYAAALRNAGQPDSAQAIFEDLVSRDDLSFQQWSDLGIGLYQTGSFEDAIKAFTEARKENPLDKQVMGNLASALEQSGQWERLQPLADTLAAWYPYSGQLVRSAIKANDNLGNSAEAEKLLNRLQEAPFQFVQLDMVDTGGGTYVVTGQLQTTSDAAANSQVEIPFEFLDGNGNVVETQSLAVELPESGGSTSVELRLNTSEDIATFRYEQVNAG